MADNKYVDFDALWEEVKPEPIEIKIFGVIETLPANLPAGTMLHLMRLDRAGGMNTATPSQIMQMAISIFGEDRINRWVRDNNMDSGMLILVIEQIMKLYTESNASGEGNKSGGKKK